jgi:hypothetical protein
MALFIFHFAFAYSKLKCYTAWFITQKPDALQLVHIFVFILLMVFVGMNEFQYLLAQCLP